MKKVFLLLFAAFFFGCAKDYSSDVLDESQSTFVSQEEAINSLKLFLNEFEPSIKGGKGRTIKNVFSSFDYSQTKSLGTADEPLTYIVNFDNDEGFAVVSGDNRVQPILVLTDSGNLSQNDTIIDPAVAAMLSIADTDYRMSVGLPIEDADGNTLEPLGTNSNGKYVYKRDLDNLIEDDIVSTPTITYTYSSWREYTRRGNQVGCYWGQSRPPYNLYTYTSDGQKAPAGCVPAAVAQILFFWGHDFSMDGYYFDWSLMRKHTGIVDYSPAYTMIG